MARNLLGIVAMAVVLAACGPVAAAPGAVVGTHVPTATTLPTATTGTLPAVGASIPRKLTAYAKLSWLSLDAAYLRLRPDGQADLWVRFDTTTNSAHGFGDISATLFSDSGPLGKPFQASVVYLTGLTLADANNWLKATIPMSDAEFALVSRVRLDVTTPPIPTAFGTSSYRASNVTAVREPDGSITVTGTLDGIVSRVDADGKLTARLEFVVLDPAGAPIGDFWSSVAPPVKGTRTFDQTPFSANSGAPSSPAPSWMPPGYIATVAVFTLLN